MSLKKDKPNIMLINCDQLAWRALPCYGNDYVKTPNIDRIANQAVIFNEAYTPCPICAPARASFWTSRLPHETRVQSNGRKFPSPNIPDSMPTLGTVFSEAGYQTVHFGKKHDYGSLRGFWCNDDRGRIESEGCETWPAFLDSDSDRYTTEDCVHWLKERPVDHNPWLMVADMVNPHDICSWIGKNKGAHTDIPLPEDYTLPELPDNFMFDDIANRPKAIQYLCCSHGRQAQTTEWTPENFRYYLAAYYNYVRKVDQEIGLILDVLESRGEFEDTIIVFLSDHGEGMASRRHVTKQVNFYEEVARVPFMFRGCGIPGREIKDVPVSLLDLVPTLCDLAGVEPPQICRGISLKPHITGEGTPVERECVVGQWMTEWGFTVSPGRMIRTKGYKYTKYVEDGTKGPFFRLETGSLDDGLGEELFDLKKDPWEKKNVAGDPAYAEVLKHHRELLKKQIAETEDGFINEKSWAGRRWRSHKLGYENHKGPAAPDFITQIEMEDLSDNPQVQDFSMMSGIPKGKRY